jgi:hypothetical protein
MQGRRSERIRIISTLLAGLSLVTSPGFAQDAAPAEAGEASPAAPPPPLTESLTGQAKSDYDSALLLFEVGDFAGAVLKFQSAYDASHDPRLLWNLAVTEKNQRRYARVESLMTDYLATGGSTLTEQDRADAQALLETVRRFIAEVSVTVNEPGASLEVDGKAAGISPLAAPLRLDMGVRSFKVSKSGFVPFSVSKDLGGGTQVTLNVDLVKEVHEGRLRIAGPAGATIRIDGKVVGLGTFEGRLPSGVHRVEVTAKGKQPWIADNMVQDGQLTTATVELKDDRALEQSSGVPAWLWIAGGTAAAGLAVGAYFLFQPDDAKPPPAVDGSLGTVELPLRF